MKVLKNKIIPLIETVLQDYDLKIEKCEDLIQDPRDRNVCDICIPCFSLAKILKENPIKIAENISKKINELSGEDIEVKSLNGYVNFSSNPKWLANKLFLENYEFFEHVSKKGSQSEWGSDCFEGNVPDSFARASQTFAIFGLVI